MRKLVLLFCVLLLTSCSRDEIEIDKNELKTTASKVEGDLLVFKDETSFVAEYSELSSMKSTEDIQRWIAQKGINSLLNNLSDSLEIENDVISDKRVIYSDALKAIVNYQGKFKIGGKTIWLKDRNFYVLVDRDIAKTAKELDLEESRLQIFGTLSNNFTYEREKSSTALGKSPIPNENRNLTFIVDLPSDKRYILDLFNETIHIANQGYLTSNMYLKYTVQFKSCSSWRCTWKNDTTSPWKIYADNLTSSVVGNYGEGPWTWSIIDHNIHYGQYTFHLAQWGRPAPALLDYTNFQVSGSITWQFLNYNAYFPVNIFWY